MHCWDVIRHGFVLLVFLTLTLYYIYAIWEYETDRSRKSTFRSEADVWLFITHTAGSGINVIIIMLDMLQSAMYVGSEISDDIWRTIKWTNKYPCKLLRFGQATWIISSIWITSTSLDFEKCAGRPSGVQLCFAKQVVSVITLVMALCFVIVTSNACAKDGIKLRIRRVNATLPLFISTDNTCTVCLDDIDPISPVSALPCGHRFHHQCIDKWITQSNTCPVCRRTLTVGQL
jgi:hypothetical protein